MKRASKMIYAAVLSLGIVTSYSVPGFASTSNQTHTEIPSASINQDFRNSGFVSGELTVKSKEAPENIVDKYYSTNAKDSINKSKKQYKKVKQFKNSVGRTVVSTTQSFNGVRVYGTEQNYHVNSDGVIECVVGNSVDNIEDKLVSSEVPSQISQQAVLNVIEKDLGFNPKYVRSPQFELILYPVKDKYQYVYAVKIQFDKPDYGDFTYYVDSKTLSVVNKDNNVLNDEQSTTGSGIGQLGFVSGLHITSDNGTYYLHNLEDNIKTTYQLSHIMYSEPDNCFDSDTPSNHQKHAVDGHNNLTKAVEFFKNTFNRNGYDNNGSQIEVMIDNDIPLNAKYESFLNSIIISTGTQTNGTNALRSDACALDVVTHEFTHAVLFNEGLSSSTYSENGALHEGISDVFGVIVKHALQPNSNCWLHGDDTGYIIRDCANPAFPTYSSYLDTNKECHKGTGVVTKAANLITVGGTYGGQTITGIGYDKLANIFYKAINDGYIVPEMTFSQFAYAALHSSDLTYGVNSQESQTVNKSFNAVGLSIAAPAPTNFRITNRSGLSVQFSWSGVPGTYALFSKPTDSSSEPTMVQGTTTANQSIDITIPVGSTDYCVAVVDSSGSRISGFSNTRTVDTYQAAPSGFRISNRSGLNVQFSWLANAGTSYALFSKRTDSTSQPTMLGTPTTNSSIDITIPWGSTDYYVAIVNTSGSRISSFSDVRTLDAYQAAPTNFAISSRTDSTVQFSWSGVAGTRYAIYRKATGSTDQFIKVPWTDTTNYSISLVTPAGSFDYSIAIVDSSGYRLSDYSTAIPVTQQIVD